MNDRPVILLLEDNAADADLLKHLLEDDGIRPRLLHVSRELEYRHQLEHGLFDLIISDFSLPAYDGLAALRFAQLCRPDVPFLFYSGTLKEECALVALRQGARDYILKQNPRRLAAAVRRILEDQAKTHEKAALEEQMRGQAQLLDLASDAIVVLELSGIISFWNNGAERLYGYSRTEATGAKFPKLLGLDSPSYAHAMTQTFLEQQWNGELRGVSKKQDLITVLSRWTLVRNSEGEPLRILTINTDITQQKRFEVQLLQAQRMESLGQMASGMAHDLKNILGPILMAAEAMRAEGKLNPQADEWAEMIQTHAERGASLLDQMLGFARGGRTEFICLNVGAVMEDVYSITRETFPRSIQVCCDIPQNLPCIEGDETQLYQILINLCINARDAMPNGGQLKIRANTVFAADVPVVKAASLPEQVYVLVEVADTGEGMPPEVMEKIFDPFFTTKPPGKGTGLGLSTVAHILKRHRAAIDVQSSPGRGTIFRLFFPAISGAAGMVPEPAHSAKSESMEERVLSNLN